MSDIISTATNQYKKRVFVYLRVSTREQAEEGYSLSEMEDRLRKYCDAMGWILVKVYIDPGYTGSNMDRPALQEMIREIEKGNADIVLVDKLDRLSRSQFDTLYLINKVFTENNCAFVSRAEAFDTSTPFGRAMVGILSVFAELERERMKERVADGKEGRAKEGKYKGGGHVPIGYDYEKESGKLMVNKYEAMQVKEVYDLFLARTPVYTIQQIMNEKGYRTKYGDWKEVTIRNMVENRVYLGEIPHKGKWYEGLHDAIIDIDTFNKAQEILKERDITNANYKQGRRYRSPLGGLIWCGCCTAKYLWRPIGAKTKTGNRRTYYMCYSRAKHDKKMIKDPNCQNTNYRSDVLEEIIFAEVRKLKTDPLYFDGIKKSIDHNARRKLIEKRINQIDSQVSKLTDLYTLGSIDLNVIKAKIEPLSGEKKSLEAELDNIKEVLSDISKEEVYELVDLFNNALESNENGLVNSILSELIEQIVIDGEEIRIHWNF